MRRLPLVASALLLVSCTFESPTPSAFPIEGVDQLTNDFAFYQDLMWSPNGEWIAASRCPIQQAQADCLGNEEAVLVNPDLGGTRAIEFSELSPNFVSSYPVAWSGTGDRLLLYVEISPSSDPAPLSERESKYVAYSPGAQTFENILSEPTSIFGWDAGSNALLLTDLSDGQVVVGWYDYADGEFEQQFAYRETGKLDGPHALSPDQSTLLRGDSRLATSCGEIDRASMLAHTGFEPFLTLACYPAWSAGGFKIAYAAKDDPQSEPNRLVIADANGNNPEPLFGNQSVAFLAYPTWAPDDARIAFTKRGLENASAVYVARVPPELRP